MRSPKGDRERCARLGDDGLNEGGFKRHAERSVEAASGARRKIAEEFAAIIVDAESGPHGQLWNRDSKRCRYEARNPTGGSSTACRLRRV